MGDPSNQMLRATRSVGGYREYAPPPDLAPVVDACWVYSVPRASAAAITTATHRILPELGVSLYFQSWRDENGRVSDGAVNLQGPIRTVQQFTPYGELHIEAVRVKPEWSRVLFAADPAEHANGCEAYRLVRSARAVRLHERLVRTTASAQAIRLLLGEVRELQDGVALDRLFMVAHTVAERIRIAGCQTRLADVARSSRITERHLRRVLHAATGIGAKRFQRIDRLNRAVATADRSRLPAWSRIATESGYYDQSHMIQEFREIAGRAPTELHEERQAE